MFAFNSVNTWVGPIIAGPGLDRLAMMRRMQARAWSMPAASTSRWVTKRRPIRPVAKTPSWRSWPARRALGHRPHPQKQYWFGRTHAHARQALQALGQRCASAWSSAKPDTWWSKRVQSRRGQHARLAQAAAQHLAPAQCLGDQLLRAAQGRAHRRAQALAEAYGHAVKVGDAARLRRTASSSPGPGPRRH
jgi:hypothetical protein